jgi:N-acyl-D-amino-acid deacylase
MGLIRPGYAANLVVFDPLWVAERATFEEPHQYCQGVEHVLVNGQLVIESGEDTGAAAGRVLKRSR